MEDVHIWKRIVELNNNWDNLTDEESRELIELRNRLTPLRYTESFYNFSTMNKADLEIDGKFYNYHKDCDKEK